MQEFDPEKPTQISAKTEYWFWLVAFSFQLSVISVIGMISYEVSPVLLWFGAAAFGFLAGAAYYLGTEEKRKSIIEQSNDPAL